MSKTTTVSSLDNKKNSEEKKKSRSTFILKSILSKRDTTLISSFSNTTKMQYMNYLLYVLTCSLTFFHVYIYIYIYIYIIHMISKETSMRVQRNFIWFITIRLLYLIFFWREIVSLLSWYRWSGKYTLNRFELLSIVFSSLLYLVVKFSLSERHSDILRNVLR